MIHEYQAGRAVCGFVEFVAWIGVVVSGIAMLISLGTSFSIRGGSIALLAIIPTMTALFLCFFVIVTVQMARASMDGSVAAQISVRDSTKQHQEILAALRSYGERAGHVAGDSPNRSPKMRRAGANAAPTNP